MRYEEVPPSMPLAAYVDCFWSFTLGEGDPGQVQHVVVPHGGCLLTVIEHRLHGVVHMALTCPSATAFQTEVQQGITYRGLRLRPGALDALLGLPVLPLVGQNVALTTSLPELAVRIRAAVAGCTDLAQFARSVGAELQWHQGRQVAGAAALDAAVQRLVALIECDDGASRLSDIMATIDLGERQLRRRFVTGVGLTPKVFFRLCRVRLACVALVQGPRRQLAVVAHRHGFADQPHFSRELQSVFGLSPQMLQQYLAQIQHLGLTQRKA